jgi:hypothetical protein
MPAENLAQKHVEYEPCCLLSFMELQLVKHTVADEETPHDLKYSNAIVLSIWMSGCVGRGCSRSTVEQILASGMRADTMDMKWMKRGFVMNHHRRVKQRRKNAME